MNAGHDFVLKVDNKLQRCKLLVIGLAVGVLVVACSGPAAPENPSASISPANQSSGTGQNSQQEQRVKKQSVQQEQNSPTGQGSLPGTEEFGLTKEELVSSIEAVESLIAQCMSEAGFEYIAADYNTVRRGMVADKSLPGLGEKQYFNRYGFGISTLYTGLPPQLAQDPIPAQIGLGGRNVQIFNNLSPADQVAYNHTLLGENSDATFAVALEIEDFSRTGGCTRAAIEQVFTPEQLQVTYVNPKDALIEQDPRMVAAIAEYGECMRANGFDYSQEREIEPDLRKRLAEITEGLPLEDLSADALAALQELQNYERAMAVVAYDCEVRIIEPVEDQVERELYAGRKGP